MSRPTPRWAAAFMRRFGLTVDDLIGFRFAVNVALATIIVWRALLIAGVPNPIWAIA